MLDAATVKHGELTWNSSESLVKSDYRHIYLLFALSDGVFGLQLRSLSIQQGQEIDYSFAIAQAGDIGGAFALASLIVQFDEDRLLCVVIGQGIFGFFQGAEYGFFIGSERFFGGGAGTADASACSA